jgi:hypothetical protein
MADVTLGQYQQWAEVTKMDLEPIKLLQRTIEIFCNIPDARAIELESIAKIETHIADMLNERPTLKPFHNDLGFIPNLTDITFGELIDLENYLPDVAKWHKAMAILYRKVSERHRDKYNIESYAGTGSAADERKVMPLDVAFGGVLFFWTIANDLATYTLPFLEEEAKMPNLPIYRPIAFSLINGDGIKAFTG